MSCSVTAQGDTDTPQLYGFMLTCEVVKCNFWCTGTSLWWDKLPDASSGWYG